MLSDPVAEAFGLIHRHPSGENFWHGLVLKTAFGREDSDVDFEASRRSTRVQSKSTIRSALFLAKH